jgi:Chaperone of endosialidase
MKNFNLRYKLLTLTVLALFVFALAADIPFIFKAGDLISAEQMNQNFAALNSGKQELIKGTCAAGSAIRSVGADGKVECEVDDIGSGAGDAGVDAINGMTGAVTLQAGDNITINDKTPGQIRISASGGGTNTNNHNHFGQTWTGKADDKSGLTVTNTANESSYAITATSGNGSGLVLHLEGPGNFGVIADSQDFGVLGVGGELGIWGISEDGAGVYGSSSSGTGVYGESTSGDGVSGFSSSKSGVYGESSSSYGVYGISSSISGVYGESTSGQGVSGSSSRGYGVYGISSSKSGVYGKSSSSDGVIGSSISRAGVYGSSTSGQGVYGFSESSYGVSGRSPSSYGVYGRTSGTNSSGIRGETEGDTLGYGVSGFSTAGIGVHGESVNNTGVFGKSTNNYAAFFTGGSGGTGACSYNGGADWSCTSDRNAKENFAPVDSVSILEAVAKLPITTWSMKGDAQQTPHMGPVAQDFYAAFGLGENDITINRADAQGVTLAAVQGLYELVQQQSEMLDLQEQRIAELEAKLSSQE